MFSKGNKSKCNGCIEEEKKVPETTFSVQLAMARYLPREPLTNNSIESAQISKMWETLQKLGTVTYFGELQTSRWRRARFTDTCYCGMVQHSRKMKAFGVDPFLTKESGYKSFQDVYQVWWSELHWNKSSAPLRFEAAIFDTIDELHLYLGKLQNTAIWWQ